MTDSVILEITDLNASAQGFQVTYNLSLSIVRDEIVGIIGPQGAGETTIFRSIMGLTEILGGSIQFEGEELAGKCHHYIPEIGIGYLPDDNRFLEFEMTVAENLNIPIWKYGEISTANQGGKSHMYDKIERLKQWEDIPISKLEPGERRLVSFGQSISLNPELLILDEPFKNLDQDQVKYLAECILDMRDDGTAIFFADQNPDRLRFLSNRIYVINRGQVVSKDEASRFALTQQLSSNEGLSQRMDGIKW